MTDTDTKNSTLTLDDMLNYGKTAAATGAVALATGCAGPMTVQDIPAHELPTIERLTESTGLFAPDQITNTLPARPRKHYDAQQMVSTLGPYSVAALDTETLSTIVSAYNLMRTFNDHDGRALLFDKMYTEVSQRENHAPGSTPLAIDTAGRYLSSVMRELHYGEIEGDIARFQFSVDNAPLNRAQKEYFHNFVGMFKEEALKLRETAHDTIIAGRLLGFADLDWLGTTDLYRTLTLATEGFDPLERGAEVLGSIGIDYTGLVNQLVEVAQKKSSNNFRIRDQTQELRLEATHAFKNGHLKEENYWATQFAITMAEQAAVRHLKGGTSGWNFVPIANAVYQWVNSDRAGGFTHLDANNPQDLPTIAVASYAGLGDINPEANVRRFQIYLVTTSNAAMLGGLAAGLFSSTSSGFSQSSVVSGAPAAAGRGAAFYGSGF
jgi:hypothetical protein